ncbi:enoyl-CoA hydratase/isomerase family protein [Kineosporia succinea]|uniref:Enoyl-CoA hydratase/carnithine racemase n=1 Tax=Kineosporia succinea TaxID=84632 RepID=A0ABT9NX32_9ACTN|nr:enoyl-CoA hydratase-related protein [Kineosporia succinea]MDP9824822.1 enoyl-CoA hydratase/carnithine racemase [Kineosporia succinea]
MTELVHLDVEDSIGVIRLSRPTMNALNAEMTEGIRNAAEDAAARPDIAAVVVYGGPDVFAAGADIKEMQPMDYTDAFVRGARLQKAFDAVASIPKPTVAAITGYALGGGCELALACDFRVAADDARLGQPEILLGLIPGAGGTQRLPRLVGPSRAKDLIFSGRFVDAAEALTIGLVDEVVPAAEVFETARRRMRMYVGGAAVALRAAKEAVDRGLETDLATGQEIERGLFSGLFATKDRTLGMQSFIENGPGKAKFEGR